MPVKSGTNTTVTRADDVLAHVNLIRLSEAVATSASTLKPQSLRSLDAIHLATALSLGHDLSGMVVYDRRLADATDFLVVFLVLADRNLRRRQIGNDGERLVQRLVGLGLRFLAGRQLVLQRRHLRHQLGRLGLVLRRLGLADLLRRRIAPRLRLL